MGNRKSSDEETPMPPHGKPPPMEEPLRCRFCGDEATRAELSAYGARCARCFDAYLKAPPPEPRGDTPVQREMRKGRRLFPDAADGEDER